MRNREWIDSVTKRIVKIFVKRVVRGHNIGNEEELLIRLQEMLVGLVETHSSWSLSPDGFNLSPVEECLDIDPIMHLVVLTVSLDVTKCGFHSFL